MSNSIVSTPISPTFQLERSSTTSTNLFITNYSTLDRQQLQTTVKLPTALPYDTREIPTKIEEKSSKWQKVLTKLKVFPSKKTERRPSVVSRVSEESKRSSIVSEYSLENATLRQIDMEAQQLDQLDQLRAAGLKSSLPRSNSLRVVDSGIVEIRQGLEVEPQQAQLVVEDWDSDSDVESPRNGETIEMKEMNKTDASLGYNLKELEELNQTQISLNFKDNQLDLLATNYTVKEGKRSCNDKLKDAWQNFCIFFTPPPQNHHIQLTAWVWALTQLIVLLALEIWITVVWFQQVIWLERTFEGRIGSGRAVLVYMFLMILALIFQWILWLDTNNRASSIQTIAMGAFQTLIFVYAIVQYFQQQILNGDDLVIIRTLFPDFQWLPTRSVEITFATLAGIFWLGWMFLCWKLISVFGWEVYRRFGANVQLRKRIIWTHVFETLLKLDVFFFLAIDIQVVVLVIALRNQIGEDDANYDAVMRNELLQNLLIVFPVTIVTLILGYVGIAKNNKWCMYLFLIGIIAAMIYMAFKLEDMYNPNTDPEKYYDSRKGLTLFIVITMILGIATFVAAIFNLIYFKRVPGTLKEAQERAEKKGDRWVIEE